MCNVIDLTGHKYEMLTVLNRYYGNDINNKCQYALWLCKCDCGNLTVAKSSPLINGVLKSCGCLRREHQYKVKHGHTNDKIYHIWVSMLQRCLNKNNLRYKNYGNRGILVCNDWMNFEPFYNWAINNGYKEDLTIDRIDVNGNYEPENCRWATIIQQENNRTNNRIIAVNGTIHTLAEWCKLLNVPYHMLYNRVRRNQDVIQFIKERI